MPAIWSSTTGRAPLPGPSPRPEGPPPPRRRPGRSCGTLPARVPADVHFRPSLAWPAQRPRGGGRVVASWRPMLTRRGPAGALRSRAVLWLPAPRPPAVPWSRMPSPTSALAKYSSPGTPTIRSGRRRRRAGPWPGPSRTRRLPRAGPGARPRPGRTAGRRRRWPAGGAVEHADGPGLGGRAHRLPRRSDGYRPAGPGRPARPRARPRRVAPPIPAAPGQDPAVGAGHLAGRVGQVDPRRDRGAHRQVGAGDAVLVADGHGRAVDEAVVVEVGLAARRRRPSPLPPPVSSTAPPP